MLDKLYDYLYRQGYHQGNKNIGLDLVDYLVKSYKFNSILDVGCSQGCAVKAYQEKNKSAWGIDISEYAIERSKKENNLETTMIGNVIKIPFTNKSFDAVVTSDVLEHVEPKLLKEAINELIRVSKKYIFARVSFSPEGEKTWLKLAKENNKDFKDIKNLHLSVLNPKEWKDLFLSTGKLKFIERKGKLFVFEVINE